MAALGLVRGGEDGQAQVLAEDELAVLGNRRRRGEVGHRCDSLDGIAEDREGKEAPGVRREDCEKACFSPRNPAELR
ncbi:hypothetical protein GCM10010345_43950 [Streptomyces canarius]|uniref:Uncharacterized protein n=1 Tax=Streptomyces canarius TaxID=285453 RepID=A0ABQ3CQJ9_9ACTN|nr:hypothetical protein GCM10010345_43950 [Streptomyces canarius]